MKRNNKVYISLLLAIIILFSNIPTFAIGSGEISESISADFEEEIQETNPDEFEESVDEQNDSLKQKQVESQSFADETAQESNGVNADNIIDSKEKLIAFINKRTITNEEYIIKGRIEINSDELPDTQLNVKGCKITGEKGLEGEDAEIIISTVDGKLPRGIFGTIENYKSDKTYNSGKPYVDFRDIAFSHISDIKFTYKGDVEKYTFAENLHGIVYEGEEGSSVIDNIDITVDGNILPDENETWKNISGFVIDCYGFDLNDIHVHVKGDIGTDKEYIEGLVGVQGLFTDGGGGKAPTRLNNSSVKVDGKMIAKAQWALVGGLTVNDNPVMANNVKSEIEGGIVVKSTGVEYDWKTPYYSGASVGFLNNHGQNILTDSGFVSVEIKINDWVVNEIEVSLGGPNTEVVPKNSRDFINVIPEEDIAPRKSEIFPDFPRVDNSTFITKSIDADSVTNVRIAGAAYYMPGTNNSVTITDEINATAAKESVIAGYGGKNEDGDKINIEIWDINFTQTGDNKFSVFGSTVNDFGTNNSSVKIGNITGKGNQNKDAILYVGGWSNTSSSGNNNKVKINNIEIEGGYNNQVYGYSRNLVDSNIDKCAVLITEDVSISGGEDTVQFGGFSGNTSGKINNSAVQVLGDITIDGIKATTKPQIAGFVGNVSSGILNNNTVLVFGEIGEFPIKQLNKSKQPIGLFAAISNDTEFNNNAVYFNSEASNTDDKLEICLVGDLTESSLADNTVLLDKDGYIQVNNLVPLNDTNTSLENNSFVEVDKGLRTAYPYNVNILNKTEDSKLGEIEIASRNFQDAYWSKGAKPEQNHADFKYVVKNEKNIPLGSYGPNADISSSTFETGKLENFYDRHMAIQSGGITYDIFGIKGGEIPYTVTYDGNNADSGEVPVDTNSPYGKDSEVTVLGNIGNLVKTGYTFKGWNTQADGKGTTYQPNATFIITGNTTLYAIWEKDRVISGGGWIPVESPTSLHKAYLQGYPDGTIQPQGKITRGEVAAIFARLHGGEEKNVPNNTETNYRDVKPTDWYAKHIAYITDKSIMKGYEDETFKPEEPITRGEFTTVVSRYKELTGTYPTTFEDVKGHWAEEYIGRVSNKQWIQGYPDGTFQPNNAITREEVATMVNKMLERKVDTKGIGNLPIKTFKDLENTRWSYYDLVEASNSHKYVRRTTNDIMENWKELVKSM